MRTIHIAADVRLIKTIEVSDEIADLCTDYEPPPDEVAALVKSDSVEDGKDGWAWDGVRGLEIVP